MQATRPFSLTFITDNIAAQKEGTDSACTDETEQHSTTAALLNSAVKPAAAATPSLLLWLYVRYSTDIYINSFSIFLCHMASLVS